MIVHTYHHIIDPESAQTRCQQALVDLWCKNWASYGWEPVVLNETNAAKHRFFNVINSSAWLQLSVNSWAYIRCCYNKYMAMENVGGGFFADPDIINYGFTPDMLSYPPERLVFYQVGVPCVIHGQANDWKKIVQFFRNCAVLRRCGWKCTVEDISDMNLVQDFYETQITTIPVVEDYASASSEAKLIHYHGGINGNRLEYIMKTRPPQF